MDRAATGSWRPKLNSRLPCRVRQLTGVPPSPLYDNAGCGDGSAELDPIAFTRAFVPPAGARRAELTSSCRTTRPTATASGRAPGPWTGLFSRALHGLVSETRGSASARSGWSNPVTGTTMPIGKAMIRLLLRPARPPAVLRGRGTSGGTTPRTACPTRTRPLWQALRAGFEAEAASQR